MHDNANWEARVRRLALACRWPVSFDHCWAAEQDTGSVPPHVMPALCSLAVQLGHPMRLDSMPTEDDLGVTTSRGPTGTITIKRGMSPASTARVLAHELGHAHKRSVEDMKTFQVRLAMVNMFGVDDPLEEAECELGAAAFCEAMSIGTGVFPSHYMTEHFGLGHVIPADRLALAAENAKMLWEAVNYAPSHV